MLAMHLIVLDTDAMVDREGIHQVEIKVQVEGYEQAHLALDRVLKVLGVEPPKEDLGWVG